MKRGFTLVELSIVLVVIGLLIGGILAAQSMIESARLNRFIKDVQQINIAATLFKQNFNCVPGDCPQAYGWWGSSCGPYSHVVNDTMTCNGDGSGYVESAHWDWYMNYDDTERCMFFKHLQLSKYWDNKTIYTCNGVTGTVDKNAPQTPFNPQTNWIVSLPCPTGSVNTNCNSTGSFIKGNHFLHSVGVYNASPGPYLRNGGTPQTQRPFTPAQALALDTKLDDANPIAGKFTIPSSDYGTGVADKWTDATQECIGYNNKYDLTFKTFACQIKLELDF